MGLNIKNERVHQLAAELASLTGESMTQAILVALEERFRLEKQKHRRRKAEDILAFADRFAPGMDPNLKSTDLGDLLYDEHGMPK